MSTSAYSLLKEERFPLWAALFCLVAGVIYQRYGHGVTSLWMSLCFLPPLWFSLIRALCRWRKSPAEPWRWRLLGAGASTLAAAMFLQGVMDIAGADSLYLPWLMGLGAGETILGSLFALGALWKGERAS